MRFFYYAFSYASTKDKYSPDLTGQQHKLQFSAPCRREMSLHEEKPSRTCFPGSLSFLLVLKLNWSKKLQPWDKYPSSRNIHPPGLSILQELFLLPDYSLEQGFGCSLESDGFPKNSVFMLKNVVCSSTPSALLCLEFTCAHSQKDI